MYKWQKQDMRIWTQGPGSLADEGLHRLSFKSAESEASYVTKYKTRNFKASGIILGSWEEQEELLPENRDKREG